MKLLLARDTKVTLKDPTIASRTSNEDIAEILMAPDSQKQGLRDIPDDGTWSAAFKGYLSLLAFLLSKASEQPSPHSEGRSLLQNCAFGGSLDCFEYLVKSGVDHAGLDKQKRTCLHSAAAGTRAGSLVQSSSTYSDGDSIQAKLTSTDGPCYSGQQKQEALSIS